MNKRRWIVGYFALVSVWLILACGFPKAGQMSPFLYDGKYPLWDHVTFRTVAETESPYLAEAGALRPDGEKILRQDVCYPALAMMMVRCFPNDAAGGWLFVIIGALAYLLAAGAFLRRYGGSSPCLDLLLICGSLPFILSVHVGNMIVYSAAAAMAFLTWRDSESRAARILASGCLAFAAVLKVSPVILGVLYLGGGWRRQLGSAVLAAILFFGMLTLPFAFYGGVDGFAAWLENARLNALAYPGRNGFGVFGIVNELLAVFAYRHETPGWVFSCARAGSVVLALSCLAGSVFRCRDSVLRIALVVIGMLFLPPTMMIYCSLYVLPVLVALTSSAKPEMAKAATIAFVTLAVPLQVPLLFGSANACFSSVALIDLSLLLLSRRGDTISAGMTAPSPG